MSRKGWIEVSQRVWAGDRDGLRCPVNDDSTLLVQWIPISDNRGEYRMYCPSCGAENYLLIKLEGGAQTSTMSHDIV